MHLSEKVTVQTSWSIRGDVGRGKEKEEGFESRRERDDGESQ